MSWSNFSGEAEAGTVIKWEKLLRSMGASASSAGFCHCLHILALREEFGELPTEQLLDKAAGHFHISVRAMERSLDNFVRRFWESAAPGTRARIAGDSQMPGPTAAEFLKLISIAAGQGEAGN